MKNILIALALIILLSSCAYYNTFFNAEKYFENAQKEALSADGTPSRSAVQNYNKAMKKCGIILTDYKDSKWADDALFMLSQCLYYKQKNYLQAKQKFEEVILYYPKSEYAQRSHIYIARCERELDKEKAYKKLRDFLVSGASQKYLVEATNLLAEYYLEDKVYSQAEYYYKKIIDNYPKSDIFEVAFFSLALLYHRNGEYPESSQIFEEFLKIRTEKKNKLNARYYIIYNDLLQEKYEDVLSGVASLMKQEYRDQELSALLILKARALAKLGDTDQADIIFEKVINENDKTLLSAESSYWRAEMHFRILNNYELAIEYYNNVRTQKATSPFVEDAVSHSAVASQIVQYHSSRDNIELQQLVSEQMKLAEYYIEVLSLPDSAMVVYDNIISHRDLLMLRLDSLQTELIELKSKLSVDSLAAISDSLATQPDSLIIPKDSLTIVLKDSTVINEAPPVIKPARSDTISQNITKLQSDIELYDNEFIPYVKFVKLWLLKNIYQDSSRTAQFYLEFRADYPDNKYSCAAEELMQNQEVEFITYAAKQQREELNYAIAIIEEQPDSAQIILQQIAADSTAQFYHDAIYSLGYLQYFIYRDTTAARPYFDEILTWQNQSERTNVISSLYFDGKFLKLQRLPALVERERRLAEEAEQLEADQLEAEAPADSTDDEMIIELEELEKPESRYMPDSDTQRSPRPKKP
ncbi:MAG: tetratricopeptide repeat protein [Candidatus Cloacimonetes bacterium]|nr:tetratricopeptide repeat protein [Candidatus Cloacimonadota bacterium]